MKLKFDFEYFCSPIWIMEDFGEHPIYENVEIENAPLNKSLKEDIDKLDDIYQATYNDDYPPEPINLDHEEEIIFIKGVLESYERMKAELHDQYDIEFNKSTWVERLKELENSGI